MNLFGIPTGKWSAGFSMSECRIAGPFLIYMDVSEDEAQVLIKEIALIEQHPCEGDKEGDKYDEWVAHFQIKGSGSIIKTKTYYKEFTRIINNYYCYEAPQSKF